MNITTQKNNHAICYGFKLWQRPVINKFLNNYKKVSFRNNDSHKNKSNADLFVWDSMATKTLTMPHQRVTQGLLGPSEEISSNLDYPTSLCIYNFSEETPSPVKAFDKTVTTMSFDQETNNLGSQLCNALLKLSSRPNKVQANLSIWHQSNKHNVLILADNIHETSFGAPRATENSLITNARRLFPISNIALQPTYLQNCGIRKTNVDKNVITNTNIHILENANPIHAIEQADTIIVNNSEHGLLGIMLNKHVVCLNNTYYSGWGLTDDIHKASKKNKELDLNSLVYALIYSFPTYIEPNSGEKINAFKTIDLLNNDDYTWPKSPFILQIHHRIKQKLIN